MTQAADCAVDSRFAPSRLSGKERDLGPGASNPAASTAAVPPLSAPPTPPRSAATPPRPRAVTVWFDPFGFVVSHPFARKEAKGWGIRWYEPKRQQAGAESDRQLVFVDADLRRCAFLKPGLALCDNKG